MTFRTTVCGAILFAGLASQAYAAQSVSAPVIIPQSAASSYYEQNGTNLCGFTGNGSSGTTGGPTGNATVCKIDFTRVPAGKDLAIEHVSCNLYTGGDLLKDISLATAQGINDVRLLPLEPTLVAENFFIYYSLNDAILYVTRGIPRLVMRTESDSQLSMACQISGRLTVSR